MSGGALIWIGRPSYFGREIHAHVEVPSSTLSSQLRLWSVSSSSSSSLSSSLLATGVYTA
jgi:hypothetical protein